MKKTFFLLSISLFLALVVDGQNYQSLVDTNKVWNVLYSEASPPSYSTTSIKLLGDTVINFNIYKKVFEIHPTNLSLYRGCIREDSNKKVYFKSLNLASGEQLIYDFSKQANDTVIVSGQYLVIHHIDSVLIDLQYRKRFFLYYAGDYYDPLFCEIWIEGIGSLNGLLASGSYGSTGAHFDLLCFFEKDTLKYHNPNYDTCEYNQPYVEINAIEAFSTVKVYPNPATSKITIELDPYLANSYFEICNLNGQIVYSCKLDGGSKTEIALTDFYSGIYVYKLYNQQTIKTGKLSIIK